MCSDDVWDAFHVHHIIIFANVQRNRLAEQNNYDPLKSSGCLSNLLMSQHFSEGPRRRCHMATPE